MAAIGRQRTTCGKRPSSQPATEIMTTSNEQEHSTEMMTNTDNDIGENSEG